MRSIHIGIGHDNNLVIAKLRDIEILMNSGSERCNHCFNFRIGVDTVQSGLLHI